MKIWEDGRDGQFGVQKIVWISKINFLLAMLACITSPSYHAIFKGQKKFWWYGCVTLIKVEMNSSSYSIAEISAAQYAE